MSSREAHSFLAINGGPVVRTEPFPAWPQFSDAHISAVTEVLHSGKVNQWTGHLIGEFERRFADYCGVSYAVAVSNGTDALELALRAVGVGAKDEVIVPSRTFIASASAAVLCGAVPVCADIDPDSQNMGLKEIEPHVTERTKALVVVHLGGWPAEMESILSFARSNDLAVVEDCSQAHGASIGGKRVGSYGDAATFSFCNDKHFTTGGEGGMITTSQEPVWRFCWEYRDHGKSYDEVMRDDHPPGFRWLHEGFGTNSRMTEMQAALGLISLSRLEQEIERRRDNAKRIAEALSAFATVRVPVPKHGVRHSYYRLYAFVEQDGLQEGWTRDRILQAIAAEGVPCFAGSCGEIYREKAFQQRGYHPDTRLPVAKLLAESSLAFRVDPALGEQELEDSCQAIHKVLSAATGSGD